MTGATAGRESEGRGRLHRPRSLTALVTDEIRRLIVTGRVALGEQLSENVLAAQLGVSRTPVREAFMRLEAERLVEVRPQRGTFVFTCDAAGVRELCELREILETGALRIALRHDRAALTEALAAAVERAASAALQGAAEHAAAEFQPFEAEFHDALVAACRNRSLIETYAGISGRVWALRCRFVTGLPEVARSRADHAAILARIGAGDDAGAEAALRHHVYKSHRAFIDRSPPTARAHAEAGETRRLDR